MLGGISSLISVRSFMICVNLTDGYSVLYHFIMPSETVTIPKEEYEELLETLEVLMDQDLLRRITISLQEFSQGKRIPFEEVKKRFLED